MASRGPRPGRKLAVFLLVVVAMYGGLALNGVWQPNLGLDLQGGTRITLTASTATGEAITDEKLEEARQIIDARVNGSGVSESEVSTQGGSNIVVEIPGEPRPDIAESVSKTAQLRFRLVAAQAGPAIPAGDAEPGTDGSGLGGTGTEGAGPGQDEPSGGSGDSENDAQPRAVSGGLLAADALTSGKAKDKKSANNKDDEQEPGTKGGQGENADGPNPEPAADVPTNESTVEELIAWTRSPDVASQAQFGAFTCEQEQVDDPAKPLLSCDEDGNRYLLSPALIEGTQLQNADFGIPQNQASYVVNLDLKSGKATDTFTTVTQTYAGTGELFAIVLDGAVLSAPQVISPITNGDAQISGDFTAETSRGLANSLKYGALPLTFENSNTTLEGPTLASDQLSAGLLAGAFGLGLVLIYCMFYYRALGAVVVASLAVAAAITYAAVIFLSETAGFTLTLPGIAGLIVAVGITADSFIVYFERIRDEMREGKSLRVAVEAGWIRARNTCLAADAVSLLAAVVLFIFAIGVVKGFAFALGISTVIDLVVFFLFTKPMVTWLARFKLFASGHKLSGLSADHIGIERIGSTVPTTIGAGR